MTLRNPPALYWEDPTRSQPSRPSGKPCKLCCLQEEKRHPLLSVCLPWTRRIQQEANQPGFLVSNASKLRGLQKENNSLYFPRICHAGTGQFQEEPNQLAFLVSCVSCVATRKKNPVPPEYLPCWNLEDPTGSQSAILFGKLCKLPGFLVQKSQHLQ